MATRPNGLWPRTASPPGPSSTGAAISLAMNPGASVTTPMPWLPSATAREDPIACRPALLAPYAGTSGSPRNAPREPTLTIRPTGRPSAGGTSIICRATHHVRLAGPSRLVARVRAQMSTHSS